MLLLLSLLCFNFLFALSCSSGLPFANIMPFKIPDSYWNIRCWPDVRYTCELLSLAMNFRLYKINETNHVFLQTCACLLSAFCQAWIILWVFLVVCRCGTSKFHSSTFFIELAWLFCGRSFDVWWSDSFFTSMGFLFPDLCMLFWMHHLSWIVIPLLMAIFVVVFVVLF